LPPYARSADAQIVNESLPIFLDAVLGGGVAAVVVSTTMIVIFGEIIPQAVSCLAGLTLLFKAQKDKKADL
jgi:CBS domain containing-hemolysin-like protein